MIRQTDALTERKPRSRVELSARYACTRRTDMLRKFLGVAMISAAVLVSACNTVEGAGRDVQSAGSAVEDAAD
jgi:predicted small secreted protein